MSSLRGGVVPERRCRVREAVPCPRGRPPCPSDRRFFRACGHLARARGTRTGGGRNTGRVSIVIRATVMLNDGSVIDSAGAVPIQNRIYDSTFALSALAFWEAAHDDLRRVPPDRFPSREWADGYGG
ncbi:hypothetical protein FAGKG844_270047 [Frankia sp. AgKG'84/4]